MALPLIVNTIPQIFCPFTTFFQRPLYQFQVQRSRFPTLSITLSSTARVMLALE
jgi:hypothetical protein